MALRWHLRLALSLAEAAVDRMDEGAPYKKALQGKHGGARRASSFRRQAPLSVPLLAILVLAEVWIKATRMPTEKSEQRAPHPLEVGQ